MSDSVVEDVVQSAKPDCSTHRSVSALSRRGYSARLIVLLGLGHSWLMKAQRFLAIIHREDASTSSGTSNDVTSPSAVSYTQQDDDVDHEQAVSEATARLHTANYVEARALLEPATDFLSRAVRAADGENRLTGALLTLVSLWKSPKREREALGYLILRSND